MKIKLLLTMVLRSALFTVPAGATEEKVTTPNPDSPAVNEPVIPTDDISNVPEEEASGDVETQSKTKKQEDADNEKDYSDIKKAANKAKRRANFTLFLLIAACGGAFLLYRKGQVEQRKRDDQQNKKIKLLEQKIAKSIDNASSSLRNEIRQIENSQHNTTRSNQEQVTGEKTNKPQEFSQSNQDNKSTTTVVSPKKGTKYFMMQTTGNRLSVTDRLLKDDNRGWFRMDFNGNIATYQINETASSQILEDVAALKVFVNDFDIIGNASSIRTIKPGRMEHRGNEWIVTEKATIKLV